MLQADNDDDDDNYDDGTISGVTWTFVRGFGSQIL
jgi:hypothetical protein